MSIDDLKLRTKTLIPLTMMAATVLVMVAVGAAKLEAVSGAASDIIEHRDLAATLLARASRNMAITTNSVLGALVYTAESPAGRAAATGFPKAIASVDSLTDLVAKLLPEKAPEIGKFKQRFDAIAEKAKAPFKIGQETPGLTSVASSNPTSSTIWPKARS